MNKNYEINIKVLEDHIPDLANWLKNEESVNWIEKIKSKNGDDNFITYLNTSPTLAYNIDDAKKDCNSFIGDRDICKEDVTVLIGFGLGHMANHIIGKMEDGHRILVIEPIADIIKMALSQYDFSEYLSNGQLAIVAPGLAEVYSILNYYEHSIVVRHWDVIIEHYVYTRPEYTELLLKTLDIINSLRCNTGTVASNGATIAENDIVSLPYLIKHRGVAELKDIFKNKPAVIVSTGPSLEKNLHHLIDYQDNVVIVAVGQALRPLLAYGIRPDFICTVDFGEVNLGHFDGILDSDVPLICLNRAYAPLLKKYKGPKFVVATSNPGYEESSVDILKHRGSIDQYGSVAHLCLGSAYFMGCDPIMLIGQDLAYQNENTKSHFNQADEMGDIEFVNGQVVWKVTDNKSILHGKDDYNFGNYVEVPGYIDDKVKTNVGLASFIAGFETQIQSFDKDRNILNCTQGGAKIRGARQWPLITALKTFSKDKVSKSCLAPLLSYADDGDMLINRVLPMIEKDISSLKDIISLSKKGIQAIGKIPKLNLLIKKHIKNSQDDKIYPIAKKIEKLFAINYKASVEAYKLSKSIPLVNVAIFGAEREIHARGMQRKDLGKDTANINHKDLLINLKRTKLILSAAEESSRKLLEQYKTTYIILDKYNRTKDVALLRTSKDTGINNMSRKHFITEIEADLKTGNFARPLLLVNKFWKDIDKNIHTNIDSELLYNIKERCLNMRNAMINNAKKLENDNDLKMIRYNDLLEYAQQVGRDNADYEKAESLLLEAYDLNPTGETVIFALACLYKKLNNDQKAKSFYRQLLKKYPDNSYYLFECGTYFISIGETNSGIKYVMQAMSIESESKKYDYFFKHMGQISHSQKNYKDAIAAYNEFLKSYPNDIKVWKLKLLSLKELNDNDIEQIEICNNKIMELSA